MRKWNSEFSIHIYQAEPDNNSPGQNICVDIDKQERNPPNLGPQVPAKQQRFSQNIQTKLLRVYIDFYSRTGGWRGSGGEIHTNSSF